MKNFNRGGGSRDRRDNNSERPEMHKAICADCGTSCEVPFKPSGNRPVLCSNCFKGKDDSIPRQSNGRDFARPRFQDKKMFRATCSDCGKSCEVPFQPSSGKPVYCSDCFGKDEKVKSPTVRPENNSYREQFDILNAKLDKILNALSPVLQKTKLEAPAKKEIIKIEEKTVTKKDSKSPKKLDKKAPSKKPVKKSTSKKK